MRTFVIILVLAFCALGGGLAVALGQVDGLAPGDEVPLFRDSVGVQKELATMRDKSPVALAFFGVDGGRGENGDELIALLNRCSKMGLPVWGLVVGDQRRVAELAGTGRVKFPVLIDDQDVIERYGADPSEPVIYLVGSDLRLRGVFRGKNSINVDFLLTLAQYWLLRDEPTQVLALCALVSDRDPDNILAKTLQGYAVLKTGKHVEAKDIFIALARGADPGERRYAGLEGLAKALFVEGSTDQALDLIRQIEAQAPDRGYVNALKGDYYVGQGKLEAARQEYEKAVTKDGGMAFQRAYAENRYGRLEARRGNYDKALSHYLRAAAFAPESLAATANQGVALLHLNKPDQALAAFRKALALNGKDQVADILAGKAEELIGLQESTAEKESGDRLIKDLADRFKKQPKPLSVFDSEDKWTSRPMVVSLIGCMDHGWLADRDGLADAATRSLVDQLNQSGRVRVADMAVINRLLEELGLSDEEKANQDVALNIGRVLAAKLVGVSTLTSHPNGASLDLRLIDSETTATPKNLTRKLTLNGSDLKKQIAWLSGQVLKTIIEQYPLQGLVSQVSPDGATINLGAGQGVVAGARFEVLEQGKPVKYKNKMIPGVLTPFGHVEVITVDPDKSTVKTIEVKRTLRVNDKVKEIVEIKK